MPRKKKEAEKPLNYDYTNEQRRNDKRKSDEEFATGTASPSSAEVGQRVAERLTRYEQITKGCMAQVNAKTPMDLPDSPHGLKTKRGNSVRVNYD